MLEVISCKCGADFAACVVGMQDDEWNTEKKKYIQKGCIVSIRETISWSNCKCNCPNIKELEAHRLEWSLKTFTEATPISSLQKLKGEIEELEYELLHGTDKDKLIDEYVDCIKCILDSMGRKGILFDEMVDGYAKKLLININRTWVKNADNSYSHVKKIETTGKPDNI